MKLEKICKLKRAEAIEAISHTVQVFYRQGVWNPYKKTDTATAIKAIQGSGYGADVSYDAKNKAYYVSIPTDSDMW